MNAENIAQTLLTKYQTGKLAHFYILSSSQEQEDYLEEWTNSLLVSCLEKDLGVSKDVARHKLEIGHADILIVKKEDKVTPYKIEDGDFDELIKIQSYDPLQLSQRLIVVHHAANIGTRYANKLLKTLEEPHPRTTLFFLNPGEQKLLPTIESRAITLRLAAPRKEQSPLESLRQYAGNENEWFSRAFAEQSDLSPDTQKAFLLWLKDKNSHGELRELLRKNKIDGPELVRLILCWKSQCQAGACELQDLMNELKWFQESSIYHNSAGERFFGLLAAAFSL